jgi:hypothetical protein
MHGRACDRVPHHDKAGHRRVAGGPLQVNQAMLAPHRRPGAAMGGTGRIMGIAVLVLQGGHQRSVTNIVTCIVARPSGAHTGFESYLSGTHACPKGQTC